MQCHLPFHLPCPLLIYNKHVPPCSRKSVPCKGWGVPLFRKGGERGWGESPVGLGNIDFVFNFYPCVSWKVRLHQMQLHFFCCVDRECSCTAVVSRLLAVAGQDNSVFMQLWSESTTSQMLAFKACIQGSGKAQQKKGGLGGLKNLYITMGHLFVFCYSCKYTLQ